MPMTSHHVVERVPQESGDQPRHRSEPPSTSQVPGDAQSGRRSREKPFSRGPLGRLVPHHRVHPGEFGVPRQDRAAEPAVEGRESEVTTAVVTEHELDAVGAESASAVVD
jgi:hypothetical protein